MATVNKDFKIKNGLVVEGTTATVNGNQVLVENTQATDDYIIDLIGGETLITSVDANDFTVNQGNLEIASGSDLARTADLPTQTSEISESLGGPLYYTDGRVKDVLVNSTQTNIVITEVGGELHITAENGVADSTTDNLTEGTINKYYSDSLVDNHLSGANGINYNAGQISINYNTGLGLDAFGKLEVDRTQTDTWYDANGAAGTVAGDLTTHISDKSTHGVTGDIVGTTDSQTLTNKRIVDDLTFGYNGVYITSDVDTNGDIEIGAASDIKLVSNGGDILLNPASGHHAYIGGATAGNEIATHSYVDNAVAGLNWKQAVNLKVDYSINVAADQVGAVFDSHDPLTTADAGYRFLLTDQNTASENGIWESYVDGSTLLLRRPTDADAYTELVGAAVYVMEGTQYGSTSWVQGNHYLTDFTGQSWTQFSGQGSVTAGTGIVVDGLEVSIDTDVVATQSDLSTGLGTKQDTLTAGNGIDIDGSNNISVDIFDFIGSANDPNYIEIGQKNGDIAIYKNNIKEYTDTLYDVTGAAATAETNANTYTDTALQSYTTTANLENTIDGYGFAYSSEIPTSTDELTEGTFNHYYTDARAEDAAGYLLANATKSNIDITYDGTSLTITAEDGIAGKTTDNLTEGEINLYFQGSRAVDAIGGSTIAPFKIDINDYRREEATQQYVASTSTVTAHTFTGNRSVKYLVRTVGNVSGTLHSQVTELLVTVDGGNNVAVTEYGTIYTSTTALSTATVDYDNGEYRLRVTTLITGAEVVAAATIMSWAD